MQHLLNDEASAYCKFHTDHKEFFNLHNGKPSETAARRPLQFIEELGLECAVWPTLYWKTSMCETHERYTDRRRLEREHGEEEVEDAEGADGQRHSVKRSFRAKLMSPLLGYGSNFALLQFVYDLQLWSELGAKRNMAERQGSKTRLMMAQHPMSPLYWRAVLAGLQDLVRQIGPPQLYWTFAPWEFSFFYSEFLLDELRKQLRGRFGAPACRPFYRPRWPFYQGQWPFYQAKAAVDHFIARRPFYLKGARADPLLGKQSALSQKDSFALHKAP